MVVSELVKTLWEAYLNNQHTQQQIDEVNVQGSSNTISGTSSDDDSIPKFPIDTNNLLEPKKESNKSRVNELTVKLDEKLLTSRSKKHDATSV